MLDLPPPELDVFMVALPGVLVCFFILDPSSVLYQI
jgi:hypothetical protein